MTNTQFNYEGSWALKVAPLDLKEEERIRQTLALIPPGVETILDAGCGDGRVLAQLAGRYRMFGVDVSYSALGRAPNRCRVAGDLSHLPFRDESFDLVLVSEVVEHIPVDALPKVVVELRRVSRKYILITVPYRETLEDAFVRCSCGFVFHKWGHIQSFDEQKLKSLLSDMVLVKVAYVGARKPADPSILKRMRQSWGGRYALPDVDTICPRCGGRSIESGKRNLLSRVFGGAGIIAGRILPPRKATWIGGLFEKSM